MMWIQRIYISGGLLLVFFVAATELTLWQGLKIAFTGVFLVLPVITLLEPLLYKISDWRRKAELKSFIKSQVNAAISDTPPTPEYTNPFAEPFQDTVKTDVLSPEDAAKINMLRSQLRPGLLDGFETIRFRCSSFNKLFLDAGCFSTRIKRIETSASCDALAMLPTEVSVRTFQVAWHSRKSADFSFDIEAKLVPVINQPYKLLVITVLVFNGVTLRF
jgi:hypothetical protein